MMCHVYPELSVARATKKIVVRKMQLHFPNLSSHPIYKELNLSCVSAMYWVGDGEIHVACAERMFESSTVSSNLT